MKTRKFDYEDLNDEQFEDLIVFICKELFGVSVQGFSTGPDGGRDAKFVGIAENWPSKADHWKGTTIIQSKHTFGYNCTFSDSDFYSNKSEQTVVGKELPRIKALKDNGKLDNYMLVANRRLSGGSETEIRGRISTSCGIPEGQISLLGIEDLDKFLKMYPNAAKHADIDPIEAPLLVSPEELSEVIEAFARQRAQWIGALDSGSLHRVSLQEKNEINKMSEDYANTFRKRYLKNTLEFDRFLSAPDNGVVLSKYESVADEFQAKIIAHRNEHQSFEKLMNYLIDLVLSRDPILRRYSKLTRAMIFYMYWKCDIGKEVDAEADETPSS